MQQEVDKDLVSPKFFQELWGLSDSWMSILSPVLSWRLFQNYFKAVRDEHNRTGVYNINHCMQPFHLLQPYEVKVLWITSETVNSEAWMPLLNPDFSLIEPVMEAYWKQYDILNQQSNKKYQGSTYLRLQAAIKEKRLESDESKAMYLRLKKSFNMSKVVDKPKFDTQNWYAQGVLILNQTFTGPSSMKWAQMHRNMWRMIIRRVLDAFQNANQKVIAVTTSDECHDLLWHLKLPTIRAKDYSEIFININEAIERQQESRNLIDWTC